MRARCLDALTRPLEDLETAAKKVDRFRKPVVLVQTLQAKADMVDRALETVSLGLALAELYVEAGEEEGEP